jgi:hypothetical protein
MSRDDVDRVTLHGLARGALVERFGVDLDRVLENIHDPNTEPTRARKILLEVRLTPKDDTRQEVGVEISSTVKLANDTSIQTTFYTGRVGGELVAVEYNAKQFDLFDPKGPDQAPAAPAEEGHDGR